MAKLLWIIIIFMVIGAFLIANSLETDFSEKEDRRSFLSEFWSWLKQLGTSTKNTAGYAIKQDWLPDINDTARAKIIVVEE